MIFDPRPVAAMRITFKGGYDTQLQRMCLIEGRAPVLAADRLGRAALPGRRPDNIAARPRDVVSAIEDMANDENKTCRLD